MVGSAEDRSTRAAAAEALGLEVSSARYLRTLDRVRRCERATRAAALLGPLAVAVPGATGGPVEVASADARVVLAKLWTAGERYRRVLEALDRDPDRIDPGAGLSPADFAALRRRLSGAPGSVAAGDHGVVAETMADARRAIRALLEAREEDSEAFRGVDPGRLADAAATAARALTLEHEARRERGQTARQPDAEADYRTPVGNSDQIRPEALEAENVDPDLIASLADEDEAVDTDELARALGTDPDAAVAAFDAGDDDVPVEEVIGASFDIGVDETEVGDGTSTEEGGTSTPERNAPADDGDGGSTDEVGGFEFGVAEEDDRD